MFRTEKLSKSEASLAFGYLKLYIDTASGEVFSQQKGFKTKKNLTEVRFFYI